MVVCELPNLEMPVRVTRTKCLDNMHYVYILRSLKDNKLYTGYTKNLSDRLFRHNNGLVHSTRNRRPLKLIYSEKFISKTEALKREKYFKTLQGSTEKILIISRV